MDRSDLPYNYLAVIPPGPPKGNIRSPEVTAERIARHIAVLFGVDVPDNPAGRTWVADYERLRVNEIAQGALSDKDGDGSQKPGKKGGFDALATATLQKYGPDNKAAIVLTGCEVLFKSVEPVFRDVLELIGVSSDGQPVANMTIFAAWALLVADMVRAQPVLAAAAVKARAIQASSSLEWEIIPTSIPLYSSERPRDMLSADDVTTRPRELSVLDRTLPPSLSLLNPHYGRGAQNSTLVTSMINNWCQYLLGSADRMAAWISTHSSGRQSHHAEAFLVPLSLARTFAYDVLNISPWVRPLDLKASAPLEFERFQKSEKQGDDFSHQGLTDRLLPGMYSPREVGRLEPRSQRALLRTHMRLLQVFRGGEDFRSTYLRAESRKHASQIVSMAERLWGDTDPMTAELRIRCAMFEHTDLKSSLPPADLTRIYDVFSDCFATINAAWRSGMVPNSVWIEFVNEFSAELRQATEFFAQSDRVKAESLSKTRAEYWHSATHETGLREAWEVAFSSPDPLPLTSMHQLLHNYLAIPFRSHDLRVVMDAVKFAYEKFIPLRKRVSESVNREITYRLALQITTLPINNLLVREDISPEDEAWLVELAEDLAIQLWDSTLRKRLFDSNSGARHDPEESDLAFLASLMRAQLSVLEHQHLASKALDETLQQTATTVRVAWETYAHLLKQNTTSSGDLVSARTDARRFTEFGEFAGRAKGLARAYDQELTQETRDTLTTSFSSVEAIQRSLGADPKSRES